MREHRMVTVRFPDILTNDGIVTTAKTGRELQVHGSIVHLVHLDRYDFLQLLDFLLYLYRLGRLIAEPLDELTHISDLLLLVLVGTLLLLTPLSAKYNILVILHLVVDDVPTGYLQRAVRYVIDERTVVTDQYDSLGTLRQKLLQPLYGLDIQVVGGLVQQQHVGFLQQDLGEFDTHTPTTRELFGGTVEISTLEAQANEGTLHLRLIVFRSQHHITVMLLGKALHQCQIVGTLIIGTLRQLLIHAVDTVLQLTGGRKGFLCLLPYGGIILQIHHLRQITDSRIVRDAHHTAGGLLLPT